MKPNFLREVSMASSYYLALESSIYERSATLCTAVTRKTAIFEPFQKHQLVAENSFAFTISLSAVYV